MESDKPEWAVIGKYFNRANSRWRISKFGLKDFDEAALVAFIGNVHENDLDIPESCKAIYAPARVTRTGPKAEDFNIL